MKELNNNEQYEKIHPGEECPTDEILINFGCLPNRYLNSTITINKTVLSCAGVRDKNSQTEIAIPTVTEDYLQLRRYPNRERKPNKYSEYKT